MLNILANDVRKLQQLTVSTIQQQDDSDHDAVMSRQVVFIKSFCTLEPLFVNCCVLKNCHVFTPPDCHAVQGIWDKRICVA